MEIRSATGWAGRVSRAMLFVLMALGGAGVRAATAPQAPGDTPTLVTIAQFEQILSANPHPKDAKFAAQLAGFKLTERAGSARLAHWLQQFSGRRTQRALTALADISAFEEPPAADLRADPAPDLETQRQIFARAIDYVAHIRPTLPNFSALRSTARFEIATRDQISGQKYAVRQFSLVTENSFYQPLGRIHPGGDEWLFFAASSASPVTYRNGHEVAAGHDQVLPTSSYQPQLSTIGEFGPILTVVLRDAIHGKLAWSHWEQGAETPLAVFRYSVPADQSNYSVSDSSSGQPSFPAYHGEIAVDPVTGAILRLMLFAETSSADLSESGIVVDYGPVEIAGKIYTCPLRSIALSRASPGPGRGVADQPLTLLNDVRFTNYHLFRSEVRIVPESGAGP